MLIARHPRAFVTDAEVMQELLHRYLALRTWSDGKKSFANFAIVMRNRVEPVYALDVEAAAGLADLHPGLSARDLLHVAVMQRLGSERIISADRGFDQVEDLLRRLDPSDVSRITSELA